METMEPIRIIIVEDLHAETEAVVRELEDADLNFVLEVVSTKKAFKSALHSFKPDIILSSYSLAETNAIKILGTTRKEGCTVPFILLAFDLSEDIAIDLLGAGVEDYVLRSTLKRLPVAIKKALQRYKTQLELLLSEVKLRASELSLREAQKIAKVGSWEWDIGKDAIVCSDEMFRIYGCERMDFTLSDARDFIHPKDKERVSQLMMKGLPNGLMPVLEYTIIAADGTIKDVRANAKAVKNGNGDIVKVIGTLQDITERKKIELDLLRKQGLLELGEEISNSGSFELDITNRKAIWSPNFYRITGIEPNTVISNELFVSCIHPDDRASYQTTFKNCVESGIGRPHIYRFIRPDNGQVVHLQANGRRIEADDSTVRWIGSVQDISERVATQMELERSQESLLEAQKIAKVGSWEWVIGSSDVSWSEEMYRIYELDRAPRLADVFDYIHPDDMNNPNVPTCHEIDGVFIPALSYRMLLPSGEIKHVISRAKQVKDENENPVKLLGMLQDVTETILANKEKEGLRIQRELTVHAARIGVWSWEMDKQELIWDDRCYDIYGLEKKVVSTQDFISSIHEDDREGVQNCIAESFVSGNYSSEYRIRVNGKIKFLLSRGKVTKGSNGQPIKMDGIIIDMTERHEMEKALRESEQLFRDMAESITEVFWLTDWKLNEVLYVSPRYESLYGLTVESLYEDPTSWSKAIHLEDVKRTTEQFRKLAMTGEYDEEYRLVMKDGSVKWVRDRAFPVFAADGSVSRVAGITEEITEQKIAQEKVKTLSLVASETSNGVLIHDVKGRITWANQGFTDITGYTEEEALGKEPWSFLKCSNTDMRVVAETYRRMAAGETHVSENVMRTKQGNEIWVSTVFNPVMDQHGNLQQIVSIGADITRQKELELLQRNMLDELEKTNAELLRRASR